MIKSSSELARLFESRRSAFKLRSPPILKTIFKSYARSHFRPFPWRDQNTSAYGVLLAEVLLKQTKAEYVVPIWRKLLAKYPNPTLLSNANVRSLAQLLRPLGLHYQRAKALKEIGRSIVRDFDGHVPNKVENLLSISHVGLYTASAVSCFKFGKRLPIVDSNVLRVFTRVIGVNFGRDIRRTKEAWSLAWVILPRRDVRLHNYGLLDFAGLICAPRVPRCRICPIRLDCAYGKAALKGVSLTSD